MWGEQHPTVSEVNDPKKIFQLSVSASGQSKTEFSNVTFQSWIKLREFDELLNMNVFCLQVDAGIMCLLCSEHPVLNTGRGKNCNVFTTEPARPQRSRKSVYMSRKSRSFSSSFRVVLFFFFLFLLIQGEKRAFSQLKAFISL